MLRDRLRDDPSIFKATEQQNPDKVFSIDDHGVLRIEKELDREIIGENITIWIAAINSVSLISTTIVYILVEDDNDNNPSWKFPSGTNFSFS